MSLTMQDTIALCSNIRLTWCFRAVQRLSPLTVFTIGFRPFESVIAEVIVIIPVFVIMAWRSRHVSHVAHIPNSLIIIHVVIIIAHVAHVASGHVVFHVSQVVAHSTHIAGHVGHVGGRLRRWCHRWRRCILWRGHRRTWIGSHRAEVAHIHASLVVGPIAHVAHVWHVLHWHVSNITTITPHQRLIAMFHPPDRHVVSRTMERIHATRLWLTLQIERCPHSCLAPYDCSTRVALLAHVP
mmetsp:Transcript_23767/g.54901  ORF Transcript_23767/g.54901 Transcript_23767/m.54901 type:complete len:240 (+) Transcript_23767:1781-2500(+)